MKPLYPWVRACFALAAIYDALLGALFLLMPFAPFAWFGVTPPNHAGYVQFPAALLVVFSWMFAQVARDPVQRRELIPFGILLKASYCGVIFFHWAVSGIPVIWKPFAGADLVFILLFWASYLRVRIPPPPGATPAAGSC